MSDRPAPDDTPIVPRLPGRPRIPDARRHYLRIRCNDEELLKFRLLGKLNHDLDINTMVRDIALDELNTMLSESPRNELIAALQAHGMTDGAIDSLLKSL